MFKMREREREGEGVGFKIIINQYLDISGKIRF